MAEAVVSTALETLRDLLLEEARFLYGVGDEVKELEWQLKEMKCLLEDADKRRHESKTILNWISEIKDLVYGAEAAIERHAAYQVSSRRRRGLGQLVRRCSCSLEECYSIHQLGSEISPIKSRLERINKEMLESGIKKSIINNTDGGESSSANNRARKSFPEFEIGDCFVGMKDELKQLGNLLRQDNEDRVISVWGMGGSGKTTIAKKLYNENKTSFDLCAWVCISQQCQSFRSVWEDVLMQLQPQTRKGVSDDEPQIREDVVANLSEWELKERLCKIQRDKRCLIVLDDLWKVSDWNELKHPFLVQNLQSKILITTREQEVAEIGCPVKVGLLKEEDALELLKKKAFPHTNIPDFALEEKFEKIGKEMVKKCGYLPLAISLLGGVLRKKNSMMEWELVKEIIYRDEKEIDGVLNLSYESLPYYLKPCFLYMGIFQEDQTIYPMDLYRMWIAQGMVSYENIGDKDKTLIEIAELYLGELVSRSIVDVEINDDGTTGRKYLSCKLHDVVRELCLKLGKREDFGVLSLEYQTGKLSNLLLHMKVRHLAIYFRREVELEPDELREDVSKHLRSLHIFNHLSSRVAVKFPSQSIFDFQKFKLLRDLVITGFEFEGRKLPKGITNLVHLRRLRLEECAFDKMPLSIRKLVYMDTLNLTHSKNIEVPNIFKEMLRLKHLFLPDYDEENIGNYRLTLDEGVVELETLWGLDSRVHELKCMNRMENLGRFSASIHDNESLSAIMNAITTNWNKLVFCRIHIKEGCELGTNEGVLNKTLTCPNLHELWIDVKLGNVLFDCESAFISSKLTKLALLDCEIEDDPMGILGKLPCLTDLYLFRKSFLGEEMTCPSNSFPRLKEVVLTLLPNLREWRVEAGAMPLLSTLEIFFCDSLKMLPDGLSGISTLRKLEIMGMPEMGKRISASGEDFHKVSHVPSIIIQDHF